MCQLQQRDDLAETDQIFDLRLGLEIGLFGQHAQQHDELLDLHHERLDVGLVLFVQLAHDVQGHFVFLLGRDLVIALVAGLFEDVRNDVEPFLGADEVGYFVLVVFDDLIFVVHEFVQQIERDTLFVVHVFVLRRDQLADFAEVIGGQLLQSSFVGADDFGVQLTGDQLVLQVLDDGWQETVEVVQDGNVLVAHQQQEPVANAFQCDDQLSGFLFQVTYVLVDLTQRNLV